MRLKSIKTNNYRTLQDIEIIFSGQYSTISGKNNAGKSCVIRLLGALFEHNDGSSWSPWNTTNYGFNYKENKTQWEHKNDPILIVYYILTNKSDDLELISFIEKIARIGIVAEDTCVEISYTVVDSDDVSISVRIDEKCVDEVAAKEISKRLRQSGSMYLYNSTRRSEDVSYFGGRPRSLFNFSMSSAEKRRLETAGKALEAELKKLAKDQVRGLGEIFDKLAERYDIELTPPEGFVSRRMPLGISLKDKTVDVPLDDWGSGTQNRTRILMAVLKANRIKTAAAPTERITPLVVIEEPESFLHPSAQAEFGRTLRQLSSEMGIQIIVTTHSPYMLNQEEAAANVLLSRTVKRGRALATRIIDTSGQGWMEPFAEHLGINTSEFTYLKPLFSSEHSKVLLLEGEIDSDYFEFLKSHPFSMEKLNSDIKVVPYGGKDTLKNTTLFQFALRRFDQVFVTYDLDADGEARGALSRAGLIPDTDSLPLGVRKPGQDCIEGLLPQSILARVTGRETDLVMALSSSDRRNAKQNLKKHFLAEFKSTSTIPNDEIKYLAHVVKKINLFFARKKI